MTSPVRACVAAGRDVDAADVRRDDLDGERLRRAAPARAVIVALPGATPMRMPPAATRATAGGRRRPLDAIVAPVARAREDRRLEPRLAVRRARARRASTTSMPRRRTGNHADVDPLDDRLRSGDDRGDRDRQRARRRRTSRARCCRRRPRSAPPWNRMRAPDTGRPWASSAWACRRSVSPATTRSAAGVTTTRAIGDAPVCVLRLLEREREGEGGEHGEYRPVKGWSRRSSVRSSGACQCGPVTCRTERLATLD